MDLKDYKNEIVNKVLYTNLQEADTFEPYKHKIMSYKKDIKWYRHSTQQSEPPSEREINNYYALDKNEPKTYIISDRPNIQPVKKVN